MLPLRLVVKIPSTLPAIFELLIPMTATHVEALRGGMAKKHNFTRKSVFKKNLTNALPNLKE